jgi:UDP:flavonoid glycosyltransferase YjiC (YdhE family)
MLPQTSEQSGVAERVSQLGAGIRLHKPDADAIRNTVEKIFADGSYKQNACKISDGFQKCSGVKGAADKILQVCENDAS